MLSQNELSYSNTNTNLSIGLSSVLVRVFIFGPSLNCLRTGSLPALCPVARNSAALCRLLIGSTKCLLGTVN